MPSKISTRLFARLRLWIDRPWLPVFLAFLAAIDAFILVIPLEALLVPCVLLRPKRWKMLAISIGVGSALGATALAEVARLYGTQVLEHLSPGLTHSAHWEKSQHYLDRFGAWGLTGIALSPIPQQPAVAWAGVGHLPLLVIFFAILLGRQIKYLFVANVTARAHHLKKHGSLFHKSPS